MLPYNSRQFQLTKKEDLEMTELVQIERLGNLAVVSMNKPPYNLIDGALLSALVAGLEEVVDSGARAVVLNGSQKHFSGGAEVELFARGGTSDVANDRPERTKTRVARWARNRRRSC